MILTNEDYKDLAAQCALNDFGRIDRNNESVYITANIFVDYELEENTGGKYQLMPR